MRQALGLPSSIQREVKTTKQTIEVPKLIPETFTLATAVFWIKST